MRFFFEYIYFRVTRLFFKRDGRTGFTGIAVVALMQLLVLESIIIAICNAIWTQEVRVAYIKQFGAFGAALALALLYLNYRRYNGKYNQYRFHWKDESRGARIIKGWLVILVIVLPFVLIGIVGGHWKK